MIKKFRVNAHLSKLDGRSIEEALDQAVKLEDVRNIRGLMGLLRP